MPNENECDDPTETAEAEVIPREPPPGSWAAVARIMAEDEDDDSGFDWDAWKDRMKDGD